MKQKLLLTAYVSIIILIGIACSRQEITTDIETSVLSDAQLEKITAANQIGLRHNQALDYLASHCDLFTVTNEQKFQIISDFFVSISNTDKQKTEWMEAKKRGCSDCNFTYNSISEWVNANKSKLSEIEIGYILQMEKALDIYNSDGIEKLIDALQVLEKTMVTDAKLTHPSMLLGTSAILRHSIQYWHDAYSNPKHLYYDVVNHDVVPRNICTYCLRVAIVDAFAYSDCLSNGHFGTWEVANNVCTGQGAYSSAIHY